MLKFEEWAFNEGRINIMQYMDLATGGSKCRHCNECQGCKKCPTECLQEDLTEYRKYRSTCIGQPASRV